MFDRSILICAMSLLTMPSALRAADQAPLSIVRSAVAAVDNEYLHARSNASWDKAKAHLLQQGYPTPAAAYQALSRQFATLGDSELNLLSGPQFANLQRDAAGDWNGIGLVDFSIDADSRGTPRIVTPIAGTPLAEAGAKPGDLVERIDDRPTQGMGHEEFIDALRAGAARGNTHLGLRRGHKHLALVVPTMKSKFQAVTTQELKVAFGKYGYIRIAQFTPDAGQEVRRAVSEFEAAGVAAYILDVRNNPGGLLDAAIAAAGAFTQGPMGFTQGVEGKPQPLEATEPVLTGKPVFILINRGTASAAEVMTAAIQGHHRGTVVGETSYGRGQAQTYHPISDDYGIVIPVAIVQSPTHKSLKGEGIEPDVEQVAETPTLKFLATSHDVVFARAMQIITDRLKEPRSADAAGFGIK
jgi:carboxyl-terminal processing protease